MQLLLCGTHYGSTYLGGLGGAGSSWRLGGILARGSEQSRSTARQQGVPFYRRLEEVADGAVDGAVVAVSGDAGDALIRGLLERGVPVLAEHPREPGFVKEALALAERKKVPFHVNGHVGDLGPVATFIDTAASANRRNPPFFVSGTLNPRTFWAGLDVLARALGGLAPSKLARASVAEPAGGDSPAPASPFTTLQGTLAGIPATLQCQSYTSRQDDGTATHVNHHLSLQYPEGTLLLGETFGPVLWLPVLGAGTPWGVPAWSTLSPPLTLHQGNDLRLAANQKALERFATHLRAGEAPPEQAPGRLREVSRTWRQALDALGPLTYVS